MLSVAVVSEIPTPYRDPLFQRLAQREDFSLHVFYCARSESGRDWSTDRPRSYRHTFLAGGQWALRRRSPISIKLNPGIILALQRGAFRVVLLGSYIQPTMQLAWLWSKLRGVPYALMWESYGPDTSSLWMRAVKRAILPGIVRGAGALLPTGSNAADYLAHLGGERSRMFFLPNTPPMEEFRDKVLGLRDQAEDAKRLLGINQRLVILYVGRMIPAKRVDVLLAAYQKLRAHRGDVALVLAGSGPEEATLRRWSAENQLPDVHFLGFIDYDTLPSVYALADLFVLPSDFEPWGAVVNEAVAAGLPVVATRKVGSARDLIVSGKNGLIVADGDAQELYQALAVLLERPDVLRDMGLSSQQLTKTWNLDACVDAFVRSVRCSLSES